MIPQIVSSSTHTHFFQAAFQGSIVEHRIRQQMLQPCIFVFKAFKGLRLADVHTAKFDLSLIDSGVADTMRSAKIGDRYTGLVLLEKANDLFFGKAAPFHLWSFGLGQRLAQTG